MNRNKFLILWIALLTMGLWLAACTQPAPTPQPAVPQSAPESAPPEQEVIRLRGQLMTPSTIAPWGPFTEGRQGLAAIDMEWSKWLTERTNGRVVIDWAEPDAVFPSFEALNAVGAGVVDLAVSFGAYYGGTLPEGEIENGLPFAWRNLAEEHECFYQYGMLPIIQEAYREKNIHYLPHPDDGIVGIGTMFDAPNPESIKGKKIRAVGLWGEYIAMLGGTPVPATWGEMYMGLKLGTYDGWVAGAATLEENKLKEVAKGFVVEPLISLAHSNLLINYDVYKSWPKDIQEVFDRDLPYVMNAASYYWRNQCNYVLTEGEREYGIKIYKWSDEDQQRVLNQAVETIYTKVAAKSARCAKLVDIVKKQMRDYGRIQ